MVSNYVNKITRALILTIILAGCSVDKTNNSHPAHNSGVFFQAPTVDISDFKSVHTRFGNDENLTVVVAISGGGERAANFAVGAFIGMEEYMLKGSHDLLDEVDYFSTVSGGGMAVAAYYSSYYSHMLKRKEDEFSFKNSIAPNGLNLRKNCRKKNVKKFYKSDLVKDYVSDPCLRRHLERGYHNNILLAFLNPKALFSNLDRGDFLELAFANEILGGNWNEVDLKYRDIFIAHNDLMVPSFPLWYPNATALGNGAIIPFSPDIIKKYRIIEYTHKLTRETYSQNSYDEYVNNIPLSLGMTASGNFPSLVTPQTLKANFNSDSQFLHMIDGGVADNLGLETAISILKQEPGENKKLLILIDAYPGTFSPYSQKQGGPNFISVYKGLPNLSLDGFRNKLLLRLTKLEEENIKVIHISFDNLYRPSVDDPYVEDYDSKQIKNLFGQINKYYENSQEVNPISKVQSVIDENPRLTPFQIARKVKTSYNITKTEQDFLIAVGRYLISVEREELTEMFH